MLRSLFWLTALLPALAAGQTTYTPYTFTTVAGVASIGSQDGTGSTAQFNHAAAVAVDGAGNTYVADTGNSTIRKITPAGVVTTLAGSPGNIGSTDGTGSAARFFDPAGVAVDNAGNVYVADTGNSTIRKVTPAGVVTTLAGSPGNSGYVDGTGQNARFDLPIGIMVDSTGNIYVTDTDNSVIRKITPAGVVTTLAGAGMTPSKGSTDGTGNTARFNSPYGSAVDSTGNVYVADTANDVIRKITPAGVVTTFAGSPGVRGSVDGTGSTARFNSPYGMAVDSAGNVYVADTFNCTIRKITPAGVVTTLAGSPGSSGSADGTGTSAQFNIPRGVAVDSTGNVYVSDFNNYTVRKITSAGVVTTLAGQAGTAGITDGTGTAALLYNPMGLAVDSGGNVYVTDVANNTIRKITPAGVVTTPLGTSGAIGSTDGTNSAARFNNPSDVTVDSAGNLYVVDTGNSTIRMVTSAGVVTTLAGTVGVRGYADGTGSAAKFNAPSGLSVDNAGNLYVADTGSNTIRKVSSGGVAYTTYSGVVTTVAGSVGNIGYANGTGGAAQFNNPAGLTVNTQGNLYVADTGNNTIRLITPAGVVSTVAGSPTDRSNPSRDGPIILARFNAPNSVAVDSAGNIYVADTGNSEIRLITPAGVVSTLAGSPGNRGMVDGTGSAAQFNIPESVAVDSAGNLHVADTDNSAIRLVTPAGVVSTLAGLGLAGSRGSADGHGSAAQFNEPQGMAVDASGNLYIADTFNATIRKMTPDGTVTTLAGTAAVQGSVNGVGNAAQFYLPTGLAVDSTGNVYVADAYNATIRKIAPDGTVSTLAGTAGTHGSTDGTAGAASFTKPTSVATDSAGNVYVADTANNTIRKITAGGVVTTLAGVAGASGSIDGVGSTARFMQPAGVAVDSAGNVYVADTGNNTIRKITSNGTVTTLAGSHLSSGSQDGTGITAWFDSPTGVTVDSAGNVFVADTVNNTIRKITPAGVVTTLGGAAGVAGNMDGTGSAAMFYSPYDVTVDNAGNIYVVDTFNNTIRKGQRSGFPTITTQPVSQTLPSGQRAVFSVTAGSSSALTYQWQILTYDSSAWSNLSDNATYSGTNTATLTVNAITAVMNGNSFQCVITNANGSVSTSPAYLVVPGSLSVSTLAGQKGTAGSADGTGTAAQFNLLSDVAVDSTGNAYVADTNNHTIRKITSAGVVTTFAGQAGSSGSADGTGTGARFNHPSGVAVDSFGTVYVSDTDNNTIRLIHSTGVVTTLAGQAGTSGSVDGTSTGASFHGPSGMVMNSDGNLYVADTLNHTIREVTSAGVVTTFAGQAGISGSADGMGTAASFHGPQGMAVDNSGHLYVADTNNSTIRKIVISTGTVTTVAGLAGNTGNIDGTVSSARFYYPSGVAADSTGNLFVADTDNHTIREITSAGVVTTQAGQAGASGSADGTGAAARFFYPTGIAVANSGTIYIADTNNHALRLGVFPVAPTIITQPQSHTVTAGFSVEFDVVASGNPTYQWYLNGTAISGATSSTYSLASPQSSNAGDYTVTVSNSYGSVTSNKATLTINAATASSSSSGGGGAMEAWFVGALAFLGMARCWRSAKGRR